MTRRHTRVLSAEQAAIEAAASVLRAGGLVGFPTETVYGLGANALDADAVRRIFEAKGRPAEDPVIVHLANSSQLEDVAILDDAASVLSRHFWPGPLTIVLPKMPAIPPEVTAGLATVAVRVPAHPIAHALLKASGLPVAAPSANLFGRPSPTRPEHVLADLNGRIDAVIDGGPVPIGVESTIVDLVSSPPRLLRPGGVPVEDIEAVLGQPLATLTTQSGGPQVSPGLLPVHYSPRTPLTLIVGPMARARLLHEVTTALAKGQRVGVVALQEDKESLPGSAHIEVVGTWQEPTLSASRLFEAMRTLDRDNLDVLFVRQLADPSSGLGRALHDRLRRASGRQLEAQV